MNETEVKSVETVESHAHDLLPINSGQITSLERSGKILRVRMSDHSEIIVEGWEEPVEALAAHLSKFMVEVLQDHCTEEIIPWAGVASRGNDPV